MKTFDELERGWQAGPPAPTERGQLHLICVRTGDGHHATPTRVAMSPEGGIAGDRWIATSPAERKLSDQVSLINTLVASLLVGGDRDRLHLPGDNLHVDLDLSEAALPVGTRLRLGAALLQITDEPHAGCTTFRARVGDDALRWVNARDFRARRLRGVYCTILEGGTVAVGDSIEVVPPRL